MRRARADAHTEAWLSIIDEWLRQHSFEAVECLRGLRRGLVVKGTEGER